MCSRFLQHRIWFFRLDDLFPGCTALIDTGALFPVWTKSRELLEALGAENVKKIFHAAVLAEMPAGILIPSRYILEN